ncbi:MAG TPA: aminotransferase class IV [Thermoanaerobaculia bacterium]|jgi:D-alanine transaminase|nr:aminotransferase class IV [Thermoanaerobaculia bacterium]
MNDILYFNGRFTTTAERVLGVEDRGFQFGDALYEVFKFNDRKPVFLGDHFRRLENGLRAIEIQSPWDESRFAAVMRELIERTAFDDGIVYIQISRGEGERKHFFPENLEPTVVAYSRAFQFPDSAKKANGIRLITAFDLRWKHCDIKSVNLLANALSKKKAQRAGADEVLLLDAGVVREGASSNFFVVRGGDVITHPLDEHILPGVVRDRVIGLAEGAGIRIDQRPVAVDELLEIDEAFITSTTMGVMPVASIDGRAISNGIGATTLRLQHLLDAAELADAAVRYSSSAV